MSSSIKIDVSCCRVGSTFISSNITLISYSLFIFRFITTVTATTSIISQELYIWIWDGIEITCIWLKRNEQCCNKQISIDWISLSTWNASYEQRHNNKARKANTKDVSKVSLKMLKSRWNCFLEYFTNKFQFKLIFE